MDDILQFKMHENNLAILKFSIFLGLDSFVAICFLRY